MWLSVYTEEKSHHTSSVSAHGKENTHVRNAITKLLESTILPHISSQYTWVKNQFTLIISLKKHQKSVHQGKI